MDNSSSRSRSRDTLGGSDSNFSNNADRQETPGTELILTSSESGSDNYKDGNSRSAASTYSRSNIPYPSLYAGGAPERHTPERPAPLTHTVSNTIENLTQAYPLQGWVPAFRAWEAARVAQVDSIIPTYRNTTSAAVYCPYFASPMEWAARSQAFHARGFVDRSVLISSVGPQTHDRHRTWMVATRHGWIPEWGYAADRHGLDTCAAVAGACSARLQPSKDEQYTASKHGLDPCAAVAGESYSGRLQPSDHEQYAAHKHWLDQCASIAGDCSARLQAFEDEQIAALMQALDEEAAQNEHDVDTDAGSGQESDEDLDPTPEYALPLDPPPSYMEATRGKNWAKNKIKKRTRAKKATAKLPKSASSHCVANPETMTGPDENQNTEDPQHVGEIMNGSSSKKVESECVKDCDTFSGQAKYVGGLKSAITKEEKIRKLKAKYQKRRANKRMIAGAPEGGHDPLDDEKDKSPKNPKKSDLDQPGGFGKIKTTTEEVMKVSRLKQKPTPALRSDEAPPPANYLTNFDRSVEGLEEGYFDEFLKSNLPWQGVGPSGWSEDFYDIPNNGYIDLKPTHWWHKEINLNPIDELARVGSPTAPGTLDERRDSISGSEMGNGTYRYDINFRTMNSELIAGGRTRVVQFGSRPLDVWDRNGSMYTRCLVLGQPPQPARDYPLMFP